MKNLCGKFKIKHEKAHCAYEDAKVTLKLYLQLQKCPDFISKRNQLESEYAERFREFKNQFVALKGDVEQKSRELFFKQRAFDRKMRMYPQ